MKYEILDENRKSLLPYFDKFKKDFYLAGGTGLALQIEHRQSIDFDFFSQNDFDTEKLFLEIKDIFLDKDIKVIQEEKGTLTILVDGVQISFLHYPYQLISELIDGEYMRIAGMLDIGCMKFSAITHRATNKDYVDIYFILKQISLNELLDFTEKKFKELNRQFILKSLVYFDDIKQEPLIYIDGHNVDFEIIKEDLIEKVKKLENI